MATLRRSDLFGFVPGGPVLDAEMNYGGYDPQHWHGRRGGPVVAAEEAYGDDDFSLQGEDDDVMFGEDLDDEPLFGEDGGDNVDHQLDQILSEMDSEDKYGADALAVPSGVESFREPLADLIRQGIREAFFGDSKLPSVFEQGAEWVSNKFEQLTAPGDMEEIAQAMLADPAFCSWNELSDDQRNAIVANAIVYASVPGVEMGIDEEIVQAWRDGIWNLPRSFYRVAVQFVTGDLPKSFYAALAENPVLGNLMQAAGVDPSNADQVLNTRAILLALLMKAGFRVDAYVAKEISENGQQVISGCQAAMAAASSPVAVEAEIAVEELVAPPVQELAETDWQMPSPEQILAFGYGVSILGSLAGVFR